MIEKYSGPWQDKQLKHLCRRTLFGYTTGDAGFFKGKSMDECLEILLTPLPAPDPPPYLDDDDSSVPRGTTWVFGKISPNLEGQRMLYIKSWMIGLMKKRRNITERMVLFWHNHFATEYNTVKDSRYNYQYFALIRKHATGNFKKLLREMTTNAQMLVYLNGNLNYKTNPNENYAREVQELFTVGKGSDSHYTEEDVINAAKVLTGWKDDKARIATYFDPQFHNSSDKVFSAFYGNSVIKGRDGAGGAEETDELLDMICRQREVAKFLCRKLYRWFVCCDIDKNAEINVIDPLADIMIASNYEIKPVLKALLSADFFYDPHFTGSIIKSPVDFVVELLREFNITNPLDPKAKIWCLLSNLTAAIGQNIGDPPAVAGWPAYYEFPLYDKEWISSDKLFGRNNLVKIFTNKLDKLVPENNCCIDVMNFVSKLSKPEDDKLLLDETLDLLFCVPLGNSQIIYFRNLLNKESKVAGTWNELWVRYHAAKSDVQLNEEVKNRLRGFFHAMLCFPEYQIR